MKAISSSFQQNAGETIVSMIFLKKCSTLDPVATGRKLNVLFAFNFRPVSTGKLYLLFVSKSSLYIVHHN